MKYQNRTLLFKSLVSDNYMQETHFRYNHISGIVHHVFPGEGGTSLWETNGDVTLDGVAFSRLDWL